jgi:murein DD-endopeptidase MepM/ murein hydrolase activator NlpD
MIWPVNGPITGVFGEQRPGHLHTGVDIAAPIGTPIHAADDGRVVLMQGVGASGGYGNFTCVQHSASLSTCYAHQSQFGTSLGAAVNKGQVIGFVGNTGNSFGAHLHFEVRVNGAPVNPMGYL